MRVRVVDFTPIGVGSLIAQGLGKPVTASLLPYAMLLCCSWSALVSHICLLTCLLKFVAERDPIEYLKNLQPAVGMAFGTSSSAAALPVSMRCGKVNGLHKSTIDFVFPLGATVNMDGSAVYYVVSVIHISAMGGHPLALAQQFKCALVGTLVTCGVAPIPGGFIVWIFMIMQAGDITYNQENVEALMAVLLIVDWFMDRCRTTINAVGDACVAAVVDRKTHGVYVKGKSTVAAPGAMEMEASQPDSFGEPSQPPPDLQTV